MEVVINTRYSAVVDLNAAALKDEIRFSHPTKLVAAGLIILGNDAGGATVKFSKASAGAASGASGNVAIILVPASNNQGKMIYANLNDLSVELLGGQEVQIEVTAEGVSTLNAIAFLDYVRTDENLKNVAAAVLTS